MPTAPDIRSLVQNFTTELSQVMRRAALEEVHAKLSVVLGEGVPTRRASGRPRKARANTIASTDGPKRRGRPGKFTHEQMDQLGSTILGHLKKNPGARSEQLTALMKMDAPTLRIPLAALLKARKIKAKGQRRGTTYFIAGTK